MAIPEKKPYERLSDYLERTLPAELEAGKSRGKATADIIAKFNAEPAKEMFAPFIWGYANNAAEADSWSPSDFTDVQYWWTADEGVTDDGSGNVETWTDQINSYDLQQVTTANMPSITTQANLNGQNVVSFNGTSDYLFNATAPASLSNSDITMLAVWYIGSATPGSGPIFGYMTFTGATGRSWIDGLNNNLRIWDGWPNIAGGGRVTQAASAGAYAHKYRYDASAGDSFYSLNTNTETAGYTSSGTNIDYTGVGLYAMGAACSDRSNPNTIFNSRYIAVDIAEAVVIHNTPTTQEMDDWKAYVNNKYGTIIS